MDLLNLLFTRAQFLSFFRHIGGEEEEEFCLHYTDHLGVRQVAVRRSPEEMARAALGIERVKKCRACNTEKRLAEFSRSRSYPDGFLYRCKSCERARVKAYHRRQDKKRIDGQGNRIKR